MAGYSDYIMSASNSLADMVSTAGTAAAAAAGQVACQVTEACHNVAHTAQQKLLSYKYEPGKTAGALEFDSNINVYPDTDSPVWMLGHQLSAKYDLTELSELVMTRPWMSYRKDFPAIGESGLTSDQGWGCMLRCGQMVLAGALVDIKLGRNWRWKLEEEKEQEYYQVMEKFQDNKSSPYSIHQISLMGESVDGKPVGTWFGPNTVAQVLRKLCKFDSSNDICVHIAMDNTLIISEVKQSCLLPVEKDPNPSDNSSEQTELNKDNEDNTEQSASSEEPTTENETSYTWKPLLLFVSLRLGLSDINPVYKSGLKACFSLPSSLGVIGGSPNHALYLLGCVDDEVLYLDPHVTQPAGHVSTCDSTYHVPHPGRINISHLDPSLALCFLCITEQEFDNLCIAIQENLIERCQTPLFEMMLERPSHLYSRLASETNDINVVPDDNTGMDYEQLSEQRKYDSDNDEFEIL